MMPGGGMGMMPDGPYGGGPMMGGPDMGMGMDGGYGDMAAGYDPSCPPGDFGHRGLLGDFFALVGPYADGGCCAPRFFDVSVEALFFKREDTGAGQPLTSQGIAGPIVLNTNQFDLNTTPTFRFTGMLQFRSMGNLEFTYYGLAYSQNQQQVNDPTNNLYSAFSQFGTDPPGGFLEDSNAAYQRMEFGSTFHSFEANYRRHWQGPNCRLQGSYLMGARYFQLQESFDFVSVSTVNAGQMRSSTATGSNLTGAQVGGDVWVCIIPGLRAGFEGKAGLFGCRDSQTTRITATSLAVPYVETAGSNDLAFLGDAAFYLTYRVNYQINLKFGYNFLYVDGVALATENFNSRPPNAFVNGSNRVALLNDNGNLFYHGASVGLEYNW
jgi:hypothetical protein